MFSTFCGSVTRWPCHRRAGAYARAELHQVGLLDYFDPIVVSGDLGYRKPDRRLFQLALDGMGTAAENMVYVGNDMYRDIFGAREAGMWTVMFDSDQGRRLISTACRTTRSRISAIF